MDDLKRILIVDDSEIDREILKSILVGEFKVIEADNGYSALEIILKNKEHFDAVLLDISMPVLDGLSVLRILRENDVEDVSVFMITSEATKDNIEKATQYNISEFIRKPFDRDEILKRVRSNLGVTARSRFTDEDIRETKRYISDLQSIYDRYLALLGADKEHNGRMVDLMRLLLEKYSSLVNEQGLDHFQIEMISKAAYFCNIGNMLLQNVPADAEQTNDKTANGVFYQHTVMGADFIKLNYSEHCRYFVDICADMCLYHHERYDGKGFPQGIAGDDIMIYTQMYGLLGRFDKLFFKCHGHNERQFDMVLYELEKDSGIVSREVFSLLQASKSDIVIYYNTHYL